MEAKTNKAITTNTVRLQGSAPRTRPWDPKDMITTGNVERFRAASVQAPVEVEPPAAEPVKVKKARGRGKGAAPEG